MITKAIVEKKRLSTLIARAALAGVVVHELLDDCGQPEYIVTKWSLTKSLRSLDALEEWLDSLAVTTRAEVS